MVNAAAYTAVDLAEQERDRAFAVNADGPRHLAEACAAHGLPLIHVSTDYVFDGTKPGAYLEDDPVAPINVYGASKEAGERAVREALPAHVILRTSWVYSAHGRNFVLTMRQLAAERDDAERGGGPARLAHLRRRIWPRRMLDDGQRPRPAGPTGYGTFHYRRRRRHHLARLRRGGDGAVPAAGPAARRRWCRSRPPTSRARRRGPRNSVLDCRLIGQVWGIRPRPWREALADVGRELAARPVKEGSSP